MKATGKRIKLKLRKLTESQERNNQKQIRVKGIAKKFLSFVVHISVVLFLCPHLRPSLVGGETICLFSLAEVTVPDALEETASMDMDGDSSALPVQTENAAEASSGQNAASATSGKSTPTSAAGLEFDREKLRTNFVDQLVEGATANFGFEKYVEKVRLLKELCVPQKLEFICENLTAARNFMVSHTGEDLNLHVMDLFFAGHIQCEICHDGDVQRYYFF